MAAAEILTDFICGRENGDAPVFSPQRFHPFVSTPKLLIDGAQTVYSIAKEKLEIPRETLFAIPNGTAAVVKVEGRRWAYIKRRTAARIVSPCAARISGAGLNGTRRNCHGIARATGQGLITRGNCSMIPHRRRSDFRRRKSNEKLTESRVVFRFGRAGFKQSNRDEKVWLNVKSGRVSSAAFRFV